MWLCAGHSSICIYIWADPTIVLWGWGLVCLKATLLSPPPHYRGRLLQPCLCRGQPDLVSTKSHKKCNNQKVFLQIFSPVIICNQQVVPIRFWLAIPWNNSIIQVHGAKKENWHIYLGTSPTSVVFVVSQGGHCLKTVSIFSANNKVTPIDRTQNSKLFSFVYFHQLWPCSQEAEARICHMRNFPSFPS